MSEVLSDNSDVRVAVLLLPTGGALSASSAEIYEAERIGRSIIVAAATDDNRG